jgi:hypothetical protein
METKTTALSDISRSTASLHWFARFALPASMLLSVLLAFGFLNNYENWGDDWAKYMLQAKAILNQNLQASIQQYAFVSQESSRTPGPVAYPWGFPLLLALEAKLFSFDLRVFKIFNIGIFFLLVLAIHRLAQKFLTAGEALALTLLFAFNPVLLHYCNHILTELPFTLVSVCAFLAIEQRGLGREASAASRLLTGALAFAAFTFRTNGILILPAATAREFLPVSSDKGFPRPALSSLLSPYISFSLLYALWGVIFPAGSDGYLQLLRAVSTRTLVTNALTYPVSLFDFFTGGHHSAILAVVFGPLVLLGAFRSWRRTAHLSVYGLLTLALYIVWPEGQGYRFMIPVTPFMVILLMLGLDEFASWKAAREFGPLLARGVEFGFPILFLAASSFVVATGRIPQEKWGPYDQPSTEMFRWIKSNTPSDAVISFFKPRAMHLLGERICLTGMPEDVPKASYFVYTKEHMWNEGEPPLEAYQQVAMLFPVFENQNFVIYRVGANH